MSGRAFRLAFFAVVLLLCALPLVSVIWASGFAERHDCVLNEAGRHPCIVKGEDWGGTLGAAFLAGWLMLVTVPVAIVAAGFMIADILGLVADRIARGRADRGAALRRAIPVVMTLLAVAALWSVDLAMNVPGHFIAVLATAVGLAVLLGLLIGARRRRGRQG